jgi:TolA-binding protein
MSRECKYYVALQDWSHSGRAVPLDSQVLAHTTVCNECKGFVDSVLEARNRGDALPLTLLSASRQQAVKLQLMAEAKRFSNRSRAQRTMGYWLAKKRVVVALSIGVAAAATTGVVSYGLFSKGYDTGSRPSSVPTAVASLKVTKGGRTETFAPLEATRPSSTVTSPALPRSNNDGRSLAPSNSGAFAPRAKPTNGDEQFALAWASLRNHRPAQAATQFDALLEGGQLDAARRADVLYWSAQAHHRAGNTNAAVSRSRRLLNEFPKSQFAPDAALLLGEAALNGRNHEQARRYLLLAKTSSHARVRERAERALSQIKE